MKFLQSKREVESNENYCPGPGYYSTIPDNPRFNDIYKTSFFENLKDAETTASISSVTIIDKQIDYENLK